jgi:hypothetical protein
MICIMVYRKTIDIILSEKKEGKDIMIFHCPGAIYNWE